MSFNNYGLYEYDYVPVIKKYIVFYKGLDETVLYEITNDKEFANYIECLIADPMLPYTFRFEYYIKCKDLEGNNIVQVSKEFFADFFKWQNKELWHEDYINRRYFEQLKSFEDAEEDNSMSSSYKKSLDPLEILITKERNKDLDLAYKTKLSTVEQARIYKFLCKNKNFSEIAREENVAKQSVYESIHNALQIYKKFF